MAPAARPRTTARLRAPAARPRVQVGAQPPRVGPTSAALSILRRLARASNPNGAPGSCGHHGAADLVARHPLHEQRHQLPRTVAVLVDFARRSDDVGPAIGLHIVLRYAAPARVEAGNDQHGVGVPLIGSAREPAKCLLRRCADGRRLLNGAPQDRTGHHHRPLAPPARSEWPLPDRTRRRQEQGGGRSARARQQAMTTTARVMADEIA